MATRAHSNQAEAFFTFGEVQDNHARNIAGILRVTGEIQVISLTEISDAMPTVGIPYPHNRDEEFAYVQVEKYNFERSRWLREFLSEKGHTNVAQARLNLVYEDGSIDPDTKRHWTNIIGVLPQKSYDSNYGPRPVPVRGWRYTPFMINDTRITGDELKMDSFLDMGPVSFTPATASYQSSPPYGSPEGTPPAEAISIVFSYPTKATIQTTEVTKPNKKNDAGDYVTSRSVVEHKTRAYYPPIPEHLKAEIDRIRNEYDAMARDAYEEDSFMYEMGGDMSIDISKVKDLAPLYNLI